MNKSIFLTLLLLTGTLYAQQEATSKPYELPTYSGRAIDYNHITPFKPLKPIDYYRINSLVLSCYPGSFLDIDISLTIGHRHSETEYEDINTGLANSGNFASIVATMPIYSTKSLERERDREVRRRELAAKATASLVRTLEELRHTNRMLTLYESLEQRSQLRVKKGLVEISEQVGYLEKISSYYAQQQIQLAALKESKLTILGFCPSDSGDYMMLKKHLENIAVADK